MISHYYRNLKRYCSEPLENIENYDKAVADTEHMWDCHHRAEILPCGRYTRAQLQKHGMYWYRPSSELIFLRHDEHWKLHNAYEPRFKKCEVVMRRMSDGFTKVFPSQQEAARWLRENGYPKADQSTISKVCDRKRKTSYGATWRYE